jgi:hypothetical protein
MADKSRGSQIALGRPATRNSSTESEQSPIGSAASLTDYQPDEELRTMAEKFLVVARYRDGLVVKGQAIGFHANHPSFRVKLDTGQQVKVRMTQLKAVFFVKDLAGNPGHTKLRGFSPEGPVDDGVDQIAVLFKDGELLTGYIDSYNSGERGFFLTPADHEGNNIRAYVIAASTNFVALGEEAEKLVGSTPRKARPLWAA